MTRQFVVALWAAGATMVCFAVSLAKVGAELDGVRLERRDLQTELHDLRQQVQTLSGERRDLHGQVEGQVKVIEQLKFDLWRTHTQAHGIAREAVVASDGSPGRSATP
ncbi:MAG TPA: hypothetical protein VGB20_02690 [bacterium]